MTDDADHLAAGIQAVECIQRHLKCFSVEGAEAFIEEQRVDTGLWLTKSDKANASARLTKKLSPPDKVLVSRATSACHVSTTSSSSSPRDLRAN